MNHLQNYPFMHDYVLQCIIMENQQYPYSGKGTAYYKKDGVDYILKTQWIDNQMEGKGVLYDDRHIVRANLYFRNGQINGECYFYDSTGSLCFKGMLINGIRDGDYEEYNSDGNRISAGFYLKGKRHCLFLHVDSDLSFWKEFSRSGELLSVSQYNQSNTIKNGLCFKFKNGVVSECLYVEKGVERYTVGKFEGDLLRQFHSNGTKLYEGCYLKDVEHAFPRHGYGKEWNERGELIYEGPFLNGHHSWEYFVTEHGWKGIRCRAHNHRVSEYQLNNQGEREGICVDYNPAGEIIRVSHWKANQLLWVEYEFIPQFLMKSGNPEKWYWKEEKEDSILPISWNRHGCCSTPSTTDNHTTKNRISNDNSVLPESYQNYRDKLILIHYHYDKHSNLHQIRYRGNHGQSLPLFPSPSPSLSFQLANNNNGNDNNKSTWLDYEGQGELFDIFTNQLVYEGAFHHNQQHGQGISYYQGYRQYAGEWKHNYPNGQGTLYLNPLSTTTSSLSSSSLSSSLSVSAITTTSTTSTSTIVTTILRNNTNTNTNSNSVIIDMNDSMNNSITTTTSNSIPRLSGEWQWGYLFTSQGWMDYLNPSTFYTSVTDKRDLPLWAERSGVIKLSNEMMESVQKKEVRKRKWKWYMEYCPWIYFYLNCLFCLVIALLPIFLHPFSFLYHLSLTTSSSFSSSSSSSSSTTTITTLSLSHSWTFSIPSIYLLTLLILILILHHRRQHHQLLPHLLPLLPFIPLTLGFAAYAIGVIPAVMTSGRLWMVGGIAIFLPFLLSLIAHIYTHSYTFLTLFGSCFSILNCLPLFFLPFAVFSSVPTTIMIFGLVMYSVGWLFSLLDVFNRWNSFLLIPVLDFVFWCIVTYPNSLPLVVLTGVLFFVMLITMSFASNQRYMDNLNQTIENLHNQIQEQQTQDTSLPKAVVIDLPNMSERDGVCQNENGGLQDPLLGTKKYIDL